MEDSPTSSIAATSSCPEGLLQLQITLSGHRRHGVAAVADAAPEAVTTAEPLEARKRPSVGRRYVATDKAAKRSISDVVPAMISTSSGSIQVSGTA
jgi:hypothetical protein